MRTLLLLLSAALLLHGQVTSVPDTGVTVTAPASGAEVVKAGTGSSFGQRGIVGGTGLPCTVGTDTITCAPDTAVVRFWSSGAGDPSANCTAGQESYVNSTNREVWECVATNTWARKSGNIYSAVDTGVDDTYAPTTCAGFPAVYASGQVVILQATTANTGASTLDCGPGAKAIKLVDGTTDPANGNITSKQPAILQYDSAANGGMGAWLLLVSTGITASSTDTLTNKTLDAEGTGNSVTIPVKVWMPAAGCQNATASLLWDTPTTNPAVAACVTGTNTQKGVADFADGANALSMQYTLLLPSDWSGAIDAKFKWLSATITGDVVWQIATSCVADAETDDPAFNTASTVTDTAKGITNQTNDASITGVTATGCSAGELLHIKVTRDPAHASDNHAATARLIGVELTLRRAM